MVVELTSASAFWLRMRVEMLVPLATFLQRASVKACRAPDDGSDENDSAGDNVCDAAVDLTCSLAHRRADYKQVSTRTHGHLNQQLFTAC